MRRLVVVALFLLAQGCSSDSNDTGGEKLVHPNGLEVVTSVEYSSVEQTQDGFLIHVSPQASSQQNQIKVEYAVSAPEGLEEKEVSGSDYFFKKEQSAVGSGEEETVLTIWKPLIGGKGVLIKQRVQSEDEPDFSSAWELAASAR